MFLLVPYNKSSAIAIVYSNSLHFGVIVLLFVCCKTVCMYMVALICCWDNENYKKSTVMDLRL